MVFLVSILWKKWKRTKNMYFLSSVFVMQSQQVILCILRNSLPFQEQKDLYLANSTTKNLGESSESALKMSFSQRAQIFHVGR